MHDQRHALQVHPNGRVAGGAIEPDEVARFRGIVRAVVGREHQLEFARASGMVRATDQLHVLGRPGRSPSHPGSRRDRGGRASVSRGRAHRPTKSHANPPSPASVRNRRRPGSAGSSEDGGRVRHTSVAIPIAKQMSPDTSASSVLPSAATMNADGAAEQREEDQRARGMRSHDPSILSEVPERAGSSAGSRRTRSDATRTSCRSTCVCVRGRGTASGRRRRPPCLARPPRSIRPTGACRSLRTVCPPNRTRPSS